MKTSDGPMDVISRRSIHRPTGIIDYVHVSTTKDYSIDRLKGCIRDALDSLDNLGRELPADWVDVRDKLKKQNNHHISFAQFQELCPKAYA